MARLARPVHPGRRERRDTRGAAQAGRRTGGPDLPGHRASPRRCAPTSCTSTPQPWPGLDWTGLDWTGLDWPSSTTRTSEFGKQFLSLLAIGDHGSLTPEP